MTPERWKHINELFHAACELAPEDRDCFLRETCDNDDGLRAEVESLISAHERTGEFLDAPAYEAGQVESADEGAVLTVGETVNQYQVLGILGIGGMGQVYLAYDSRLRRRVALKLLPPSVTNNPDRLQRFEREAWSASALNHPNILTIHETGRIGSSQFIAYEFVDGETVRARLQVGGGFQIVEALDVAVQICAALAAAHKAGVVHRDIKPENVMVRHDKLVKVLDFGLAKLMENKETSFDTQTANPTLIKTKPGVVMGTVAYMSPEQTRGQEVDARTDVFSLGIVLYEMLTGRVPFLGESTSDVIAAILKTEAAPPSSINHEIPDELDKIVERALGKNCDDRYQTAEAFLADLRQLKQRREFDVAAAGEYGVSPFRILKSTNEEPQNSDAETRILETASHNSIAVLPFANVSADAENEYFCDGLAEELLNALSRIKDLKVVARTSAFSFKGKNANVSVIGRALGVRNVLEGSVRKSGNRLRITVQLVDTENGYHLWSERYDREMQDIFHMQDEITLAVVDVLMVKLLGQEKAAPLKRHTENIEAYQLYLKGRYHWKKWSSDGLQKSMECFNKAIALDSNYALAYSGLADCYTVLGVFRPPREAFSKAKEAAAKALELDDTLSEAHTSLAVVNIFYDWDWFAGEREVRRAIELNPGNTGAHLANYSYLIAMGRLAEAFAAIKKAQDIDPLSLFINTSIGWALYLRGEYDEAIEQYRKVLEMDADYSPVHSSLVSVYLKKNMYAEAIGQIQKAQDNSDFGPHWLTQLGYAYAVSSNRKEAQNVLERLIGLSTGSEVNIDPADIAMIYSGLNDRDQAFEWLNRAVEYRSMNMVWLKGEPIWDNLRSDARFTELLRRVGLTV